MVEIDEIDHGHQSQGSQIQVSSSVHDVHLGIAHSNAGCCTNMSLGGLIKKKGENEVSHREAKL